jgi:polar amino acid transport system substrate-binding protein
MTSQRARARTIVLGMSLIASLIGVGLTPAGVPGVRAESILEKLKDQGSIRMGFANENPFSYTTAEGELAGVDVDILRDILAEMGVNDIEGGLTTFGDLIAGL